MTIIAKVDMGGLVEVQLDFREVTQYQVMYKLLVHVNTLSFFSQ